MGYDLMEMRDKQNLMRALRDKEYPYEYPEGLDLHPASELSRKLCKHLVESAKQAKHEVSKRQQLWERLDWSLSAYVPLDKAEKVAKQRDFRKPVNVVIPVSFAATEVFLTHMSHSFLQDPYHRFRGLGSMESKLAAAKLERLVQRQNHWFKAGLKYTTMWRDAFAYGIGAVHVGWRKQHAKTYIDQEVSELIASMLQDIIPDVQPGDVVRYLGEDKFIFEGNRLTNLDPYNLLLDSNANINDYQEQAEFIGWLDHTNALRLLEREKDPEEQLYNGKYVYDMAYQGDAMAPSLSWDRSGREGYLGGGDRRQESQAQDRKHPVTLTYLYRKIIPSHWNLGDSDEPEIWSFVLAGEDVIMRAEPAGYDHGYFPVAMCAPTTTGYDVIPASYLATTFGLGQYIDFKFTSSIKNQAKVLNDMIVYDPLRVYAEDLMNPGPGKLIRMKPMAAAMPGGIDSIVRQLNVQDVTQNNVRDVHLAMGLVEQVLGTTAITQGNMENLPERPTLGGIQMASNAAMGRLHRIARIIGEQAHQDLAWQEAYNTLQFMEEPVQVSILGRYEQQLRDELGLPEGDVDLQVEPWDLDPNFEILPFNGGMPMMENQDAWNQVLQILLNVEGVAQGLLEEVGGISPIFKHWLRINGAPDLYDFFTRGGMMNLEPQVVPDEQAAEMAASGEYAALDQMEPV